MKSLIFLTLVSLSTITNLLIAQAPPHGQFVVKAGENVNMAILFQDKYIFPSFEYGFAYFKNGGHSEELRLNYNKLTTSMNWINAKGDTMAFSNTAPIHYVKINNDVFLHDEKLGYLLVIDTKDSIMLASQQIFDIVRKESAQGDGYGNVSQTTASRSTLNQRNTNNQAIVNENTVFGKKEHFYLVDSKLKVEVANKGGFFKMFPALKPQIINYIKREKIDFYAGAAPVEKLFQYCMSMPK